MSAIVWDAVGQRLFETGVSKGVFYPINENNEYKGGVAWNGLINVTEQPSGAEVTDLWADNILYASLRAAEKFGASVEAYTYPPEFALCDGTAEPVKGVRIGQQKRKPFGFCYRTEIENDTATETDNGYKLHLVYNATASPSEKTRNTVNESPDATTFNWEFNTTPVPVTGYKPTSHIEIDSTVVDATKLAELEAVLYGTDDEEARMPLPDEVFTMLKTA